MDGMAGNNWIESNNHSTGSSRQNTGGTSNSFSRAATGSAEFGSGSQDSSSTASCTRSQLPANLLVIGVAGGIGSGKSTACRMLVSDINNGDMGDYQTSADAKNPTTDSFNGSSHAASQNAAIHLDADSIAHGLYKPNSPVATAISREFGSDVIDQKTGEINRPALGAVIFQDPSARKKLEQIVWPLTKQEVWNRIQSFVSQHSNKTVNTTTITDSITGSRIEVAVPVVIVEAALLLEAGWDDLLDALWVVTASREVALDRLVNGPRAMESSDAQRRMDDQEKRPGMSPSSLQKYVQQGIVTAVIDNCSTEDTLRQNLQKALARTLQLWHTKTRDSRQTP